MIDTLLEWLALVYYPLKLQEPIISIFINRLRNYILRNRLRDPVGGHLPDAGGWRFFGPDRGYFDRENPYFFIILVA